MQPSVGARSSGACKPGRTSSCSSPPCFEMVSARIRGMYICAVMTSIKVPPLGESIVEATVSKWLKNEGEVVSPGDTLVELETDKITVEVPSITGGVLKKRFANEGDIVKLDQLLGEVDEKADGARPAAPQKAAGASAPTPAAPAPAAGPGPPKDPPR